MSTVLSQRSMTDKIESSINKDVSGGIEISGRHGLRITSMAEAMEFAKLMSIAKEGVPKHCRDNVGICLAISIQAYELQISPLALANKSYVVNDRLAYESAMYQVCLTRRAPIIGRPLHEYTGEGPTRQLRVSVRLSDGSGITLDYTSPMIKDIRPQNSPLWKNDPDQQLSYFAIRSLAKRHFQDVVMGILTVDEMMDSPIEIVKTVESRQKVDRLAEQLLPPSAIKYEPQPEPYTPDPYFVPQDTDDRKVREPERTVTDPQPQSERPPEPPTAMGFIEAIEGALNDTALRKIGLDASKAQADGFIDMNELEEINGMIQEAKKILKG